VLPCGELAGACRPPWPLDELLPDELLPDPLAPDPFEELPAPADELPADELELDGELVAAWVGPGRMATMTPAAATLARVTVMVVAFSRRRPSSRSAIASAI
jgi:hypothetical protein